MPIESQKYSKDGNAMKPEFLAVDSQTEKLARELEQRSRFIVQFYAIVGGLIGFLFGTEVAETLGGGIITASAIFLGCLAVGTEVGRSRRLDFLWKAAIFRRLLCR